MQLIGRWGGTLKFFPADPDARLGIALEIVDMCSTIEQVEWLVRRAPKIFQQWPGMREVRALLCSKFAPKDGCEVFSELYTDGIPSELQSVRSIEAERDPRDRSLPPGEAGEIVAGLVKRKNF
jgi:hypothetical protein